MENDWKEGRHLRPGFFGERRSNDFPPTSFGQEDRAGNVTASIPGLREWDPDQRHLGRREWDPGNYGGLDRERGPQGHSEDVPVSRRGPFRGMGPKNYLRSDDRICEDVCERLTEADDIDARGITVKVRSGEVTLEGCVATLRSRCAAEHQALSCRGVTDVRNKLEVRSGHQVMR